MSFKQVLGVAFREWDLQHCKMMYACKDDGKQYKLAAAVAKYVALKKYNTVLS